MPGKAQGDTTEKEKQKGRPKLLIAVMMALLLIVFAGGGYHYFSAKKQQPAVKAAVAAPELQHNLDLGGMVVNLSGSTSRYLRLSPVIVIQYENKKKIEKELEEKKYQIKDVLLILLRSKTMEEISTAQGVEHLKRQMADVVNGILESGRVGEVYFTEFLLQ